MRNMLRLLCINARPVKHESGIVSSGEGLVEGEIYKAVNIVYIHPNNKKECWFTKLGLRLCCRFIPLSEIDETKMIQNIEVGAFEFSNEQ